MKRLLLTAVCVSLLSVNVNALAKDSHHKDAEPARREMAMREDLAKKLNLTDEQKEQADKIREEGRKKMEPLMKEKKELRKKMDKLRKENMEDFEEILTPEQKAEFAKIKEEHRTRDGKGEKMHKGEKHRKHMKELPEPKVEKGKSESKK